jgi:hypothetical protein
MTSDSNNTNIQVPATLPMGWICPLCGVALAPHVPVCPCAYTIWKPPVSPYCGNNVCGIKETTNDNERTSP